jgi:hypothetical protein
LKAQDIVLRLLEGEREIKFTCQDERSAIHLYTSIRRIIERLGLTHLDDVSVCLAPERAIIKLFPPKT